MDSPTLGRVDTNVAMDEFARRDSELPDLPIDEHSYLKDNTPSFVHRSDEPSEFPFEIDEGHSVDERELRRHFQDVESSFLPDERPATTNGDRLGVDDTYLELGKPGRTPPPDQMFASLQGGAKDHIIEQQHAGAEEEESPDTPADAYKTPAPGRDEYEHEYENGDYDEPDSPSSPAAAAAHRGHTRNLSTASATRLMSVRANSISVKSSSSSRPTSSDRDRPTSQASTARQASSPQPHDVALPDSEAASLLTSNGYHSSTSSRLSKRPSFLNSRTSSQHSSVSSATVTSDLSGSDTTLNADYALQTGGAAPGNSLFGNSSRAAHMLSRLPSFGSVASYMTRDSDERPSLSRGISSGSVLASRRDRFLDSHDEADEPETPRPGTANYEHAPTDTVIAQHVQSIQVPETVARDFRLRNRSLSPDKNRPASSSGPATASFGDRPRRTLTLKEQNSKIDKLTKENFDLKLKIHFLDQALQSRSDDGVKELIDKNVQLQTDLANERKESQALRRKMRELERRVAEQEKVLEESQRSQSKPSYEDDDEDPTLQAEMHEEILYLRQQLDHSENQVTMLREEIMTEKLEKRKMTEHMRSMAGRRGEENAGVKETMEMWQDLLNAETGRREQAEEDIRKLREELSALRIERASPAANRVDKRTNRRSRLGYQESVDGESEYTNGVNGSVADSAVVVDQLKHENAELRRDLGAQTSMLTSRNRERERLQQEIEDLKLMARKSDGTRSVAGESIFERSISRAHQRAPSRASDTGTHVTEAERDDWDKKEGQLRDQNAELRLKFQELERTHNTHLQYVSVLEGDFQEMEQELNNAEEDLKALATERDDALNTAEDMQAQYDRLEQEAVAEIEKLEKELEDLQAQHQEATKRAQKTQTKLERTTENYKGMQFELGEITTSVTNLEDEKQANMRTIETLEQQINEAEDEIQKWEQKCKELDQKNRKLEITQESLHSEITFLREEQEGDKIKIGELEDALNAAQQTIQDEQEKLRELEDAIQEERHQRDVLENQSKEEVQKVLDDLNTENGKTKDEVRKLRRGLSAKEVEASTWKQRLEELEQSLRHALGDPNGTKQSLLAEIEKLQRDLETTAHQLDRTKMEAADKDRLLRHRDGLLENTSLESRRLSDLLDKERNARKHDLEQFERSSRGQATHMRTVAQYESRVLELETAYSQDKRKMAALEQQYRDQLVERNNLLLALWNRLSTLCGADWAQAHSLVNGEVPSTEVISKALPAFNKNIISAVKTVEGLIGTFKMRIRGIEKDLWKDYQTLEHNLDMRIRRMDMLEHAVKDAQTRIAEEAAQRPPISRASTSSKNVKSTQEIAKLQSEMKLLKAELKFHRQHPSPMAQQMLNQQNQLNPDLARRQSSAGSGSLKPPSPARAIVNQLLRHHSTSAVEQLHSPVGNSIAEGVPYDDRNPRQQPIVIATPPIQPSEQRWIHRLKELERRLKAEREARLLDRRGARQRLEEGRLENEELRQMLEREKVRSGSIADTGSIAGSERQSRRGSDVDWNEKGSVR